MSDTNKKSVDNQDRNCDLTSSQLIIKGNFCTTNEVAKIIGVTRQAVDNWRAKDWFAPDFVDRTGVFYYSIERVVQLKSVYHKGWQKTWASGGYQAPVEPQAVPTTAPKFSDVLMAENPHAAISKITGGLRPSRIRVEINDKLAKVIFKLSDEGTDYLLNGDTFCIVEKRSKKFGEITTAISGTEIYSAVQW